MSGMWMSKSTKNGLALRRCSSACLTPLAATTSYPQFETKRLATSTLSSLSSTMSTGTSGINARRGSSSVEGAGVVISPGLSGNEMRNFEPSPSWLCTLRVPPCSSTNFWVMANPNPTPWLVTLTVPLLACSNGARIRSKSDSAMPLPVSLTCMSNRPSDH